MHRDRFPRADRANPLVGLALDADPVGRDAHGARQVRSHRVATVTLSADHRVTDGHRGARFLAEVDRILQEPIPP